jgi:hypothetical protein
VLPPSILHCATPSINVLYCTYLGVASLRLPFSADLPRDVILVGAGICLGTSA